MSPNYPGDYGINKDCMVAAFRAGAISVELVPGGFKLCPTAAPTPTPPPPPTGPMWTVVTGDCTVDEDLCIRSPGFPSSYGNNEACDINVEASLATPIRAVDFQTEEKYDFLTVSTGTREVQYHGTIGPEGVTPVDKIIWSSDSSVTRGGWRLCPQLKAEESTAPPR